MIQIPIVSKPQPRQQRLIYIFKRHRWELMAMGMTLLIYLFIFSQMPTSVFWSPDEGAKFIQLRTLRWDGGVQYQIPYPGKRLDPAYTFYPHPLDRSHPDYDQSVLYPRLMADGSARFNWPIWFSLISVVPFQLWGITGLYVVPLISGLLSVALAGRLTYRLNPAAAPLALVGVGLASPILFYSFLFWEHTLVVLLALATLWQVTQLGQRKWLALISVGLLLVGMVVLRLEMIFFALALILAGGFAGLIHHQWGFSFQATLRPRGKLMMAGGISLVLLIFLSLSNLIQSTWLDPKGTEFIAHGLMMLQEPRLWLILPVRLRDVWINTSVELGPETPLPLAWLGLAGVLMGGLAIALRQRTRVWLLLIGGLLVGLGSGYVLWSPQRYRAIHSLLLPAPYLVFANLFLVYAGQKRRFDATVLGLTTLFYLALGSMAVVIGVDGGLEWGARYLLTAYPLLVICAAVGIYHFYQTETSGWLKQLLLTMAALLLLIGISYEARGVQEIQTTKKDLVAYQSVLTVTQQPVITDLYWLPAALTCRFMAQEIYTLARREDLYTWLNLTSHQVDSFLFASFTPLSPNFIKRAPYPLVRRGERVVHGMIFTEFEVLKINAAPVSAFDTK